MKTDNFKNDSKISEMISKYFDENFFDLLNTFQYKRVGWANAEEKRKQRAGIDIELITPNGNTVNIDEKAKIQGLINQKVEKIAFELNAWSKDGWFVNDNIKTDYYAIEALSATTENEDNLQPEDITQALLMLVKKQDIFDYLKENYSITKSLLKSDATDLLYNNVRKTYYPAKPTDRDLYLTITRRFNSCPVNLVLYTEMLQRLPHTKMFLISNNGIKKLTKYI